MQAFHGCPDCFPNRRTKLPRSDLSASDAYQNTLSRHAALEAQGYTIRALWECELKEELADTPEMRDFFRTVDVIDPIEARDAFHGGEWFTSFVFNTST